jgi:hypothetical protein
MSYLNVLSQQIPRETGKSGNIPVSISSDSLHSCVQHFHYTNQPPLCSVRNWNSMETEGRSGAVSATCWFSRVLTGMTAIRYCEE